MFLSKTQYSPDFLTLTNRLQIFPFDKNFANRRNIKDAVGIG